MVKKKTGLCESELDKAAKEGDLARRAMCNLKTGFWLEFGKGEVAQVGCVQRVPVPPFCARRSTGVWSGVSYSHSECHCFSTFQLSTFPPMC